MSQLDAELGRMAVLEIDELSMVEKLVLAWVHQRLIQWRYAKYHPLHCSQRECRCGTRLPFGGVKVVLAGDFGQLPPVAVVPEKTLLNAKAVQQGQNKQEVNLGLRLFMSIRNVFRLRRIHRQVGQSTYKESLLRIRDAGGSVAVPRPVQPFVHADRKGAPRVREEPCAHVLRKSQSWHV